MHGGARLGRGNPRLGPGPHGETPAGDALRRQPGAGPQEVAARASIINQQGPAHTEVVVVAAAELSHNDAGRAFTLAQLYQHLGHPVALLGSHFPQWGRELWEPIQTAVIKAQLPVHTFVAEHEPRYVEQAFELVLQHPADLVHLSKPRLPAVVIGLFYKLLLGAAVQVDIDDEELCNACERELMGPLWTRLGVDLAQRFDGIFGGGLLSQPPGGETCRGRRGKRGQGLSMPIKASRTTAQRAHEVQLPCLTSQAARSAGPLKCRSASVSASSWSSGRALMLAVVASLRGPHTRLSWRSASLASPRASPRASPSAIQSWARRVWRR